MGRNAEVAGAVGNGFGQCQNMAKAVGNGFDQWQNLSKAVDNESLDRPAAVGHGSSKGEATAPLAIQRRSLQLPFWVMSAEDRAHGDRVSVGIGRDDHRIQGWG